MPGLESGLTTTLLAGSALAANLHGAPALQPYEASQSVETPLSGSLEIRMPYAPAYSSDPAAQHLPRGAYEALEGYAETVTAVHQSDGGNQKMKFVVRGYASPDNKFTGDAGLRETTPQDKRLATQRGEVVARALRLILHKDGLHIPVTVLPGQDVTLTKAQTSEVKDWAHALNYNDAGGLVRAWREGKLDGDQPILSATLQHRIGDLSMVRVVAQPKDATDAPLPLQQSPDGA